MPVSDESASSRSSIEGITCSTSSGWWNIFWPRDTSHAPCREPEANPSTSVCQYLCHASLRVRHSRYGKTSLVGRTSLGRSFRPRVGPHRGPSSTKTRTEPPRTKDKRGVTLRGKPWETSTGSMAVQPSLAPLPFRVCPCLELISLCRVVIVVWPPGRPRRGGARRRRAGGHERRAGARQRDNEHRTGSRRNRRNSLTRKAEVGVPFHTIVCGRQSLVASRPSMHRRVRGVDQTPRTARTPRWCLRLLQIYAIIGLPLSSDGLINNVDLRRADGDLLVIARPPSRHTYGFVISDDRGSRYDLPLAEIRQYLLSGVPASHQHDICFIEAGVGLGREPLSGGASKGPRQSRNQAKKKRLKPLPLPCLYWLEGDVPPELVDEAVSRSILIHA